MKNIYNKICDLRRLNADKYRAGKAALILFYPVLILLVSEMNHIQSFRGMFLYCRDNTHSLLFSLFYEVLFFTALFFVTRSAVISMSANSLVLFVLSCVEYYKFESSGTHFTVADLAMARNLSDLTSFAKIDIKPVLALNLIFLVLYIFTVYMLNIKIKIRRLKSIASGSVLAVLLVLFITVPVMASELSELFEIENEKSAQSFTGSGSFKQTNFMTSFIESMTNQFISAVKPPDGYSEQSVLNALLPADGIDKADKTDKVDKSAAVKPNVIFVMSEAYADFRRLPDVYNIPDGAYANFDLLASEGYSGTCIVPTFGGYTVRTEFEMLFGFPVLSLNTPEIPHLKINVSDKSKLPSMANFYKSHGYTSTYIHPFSSTFYGRDDIYPFYGFDNLYFADGLTVPVKYKGKYIDDYTTFDMTMRVIESSDTPQYIAVTTMQNHVPYVEGRENSSGGEEFAAYMDGISATDSALGVLRERLLESGEPTVIVFVGDHYPSFTAAGNIYDSLNINASNCAELYEQSYFIWSNYGLDLSEMENYPVLSAFYLPNITAKLTGLPATKVINTLLSRMSELPVYSPNHTEKGTRDEVLDLLTYDLFLGKNYAGVIKSR